MRLIDADALIKYCDINWIPLNVDAVNAQPTIDPVKWIPVTERLPEEGKQVLVCDDGGFIYTAEGETRSDGEWQWYESVEYRPMDDVVAWMPLPEPWKGEEG